MVRWLCQEFIAKMSVIFGDFVAEKNGFQCGNKAYSCGECPSTHAKTPARINYIACVKYLSFFFLLFFF
jgi:hypothetical protein